MDSTIIENLGCPLDPDLLKSWERFSLESSHSYTSSDPSESADEETDVNHDDLVQQLKNISIDDGSDSKYVSAKCSNDIAEINARKEDNSEDLIILESEEEADENLSSFLSSLKNKELLKFTVEANVKSVFSKLSNKNSEINTRKKNNTEKVISVDSTEINENRFSSSSFENNKPLNNDYKSSSDASAEDESDSDNDEQEKSVTLRERYPSRHNRSENNNRQQRTAPFPQNHSRTLIQHSHSNNSQISANYHSALNNFNDSHDSYEYFQNNSTRSERYNRTFSPNFPNSESVTDEAVRGIVSSIMVDQIVNGVIPYTGMGEVFDGVAPYAGDIRNVNNTFSAEINDVSYFNNLGENTLPESISRGCAVTNEERFSDSHFDKQTVEEVDYFLKCLTGSNSGSFSTQNTVDLIQDNSVASTSKEISYPSNQYNFATESNDLHYSFSNKNVEETSSNSNLDKGNGNLETSGELYSLECSAKNSGNYSNMVSKNFTSINSKCLSPATSDFDDVWKEIKKLISGEHEMDEMEAWVMKGQNNMPKLSPPITDNPSIPECINASECELSGKKKGSKSKCIIRTRESVYKAEERKIRRSWPTEAGDKLFNSASFSISEWKHENVKMRQQIEKGELGTEKKKIIHFTKINRKTRYRGTNLHHAIREGNKEKVYCIVELHKECHDTTNEINLRDSSHETVLDYLKKNFVKENEEMVLLADYLEENDAGEFGSCVITK